MDSVLIDGWLGDASRTPVIDEASVAVVRQLVREEASALNLSEQVTGSLVNVASELGHNQLRHARNGVIVVRAAFREGTAGLEIVAADEGHGISNPEEALRGRPADSARPGVTTSLGIGLAAVVELADEVDIDVRVGAGTCVWARKFALRVARRRQVGLYGRPCPGEVVSGDHAGFARETDSLLVGLADGLGHGPLAFEASLRAIDTFREERALTVERILERCDKELHGTRGAVMAIANLEEPAGAMKMAIAGNVSAHIYGPDGARRMSGPSYVLGIPRGMRRPTGTDESLGPHDALVLFSDGLSTRTDFGGDLDLLREHPIVIAHRFVQRFGRDNDDALVLVVR